MPDPNNPGRTLTEDILKDLENTMLPNSESGFVLKRLRVKADEQARRKLGRRIEMGPGDGEITLVESGCGEEGTCQCIAVKGAEPVTLEPAEMTFTIEGLFAAGLQPAVGWETFSITVTATVVTRIAAARNSMRAA